jgi:hypothetical protein
LPDPYEIDQEVAKSLAVGSRIMTTFFESGETGPLFAAAVNREIAASNGDPGRVIHGLAMTTAVALAMAGTAAGGMPGRNLLAGYLDNLSSQ